MKAWWCLAIIGVYLGVIQTLHVARHSEFCKTEAEWERTK